MVGQLCYPTFSAPLALNFRCCGCSRLLLATNPPHPLPPLACLVVCYSRSAVCQCMVCVCAALHVRPHSLFQPPPLSLFPRMTVAIHPASSSSSPAFAVPSEAVDSLCNRKPSHTSPNLTYIQNPPPSSLLTTPPFAFPSSSLFGFTDVCIFDISLFALLFFFAFASILSSPNPPPIIIIIPPPSIHLIARPICCFLIPIFHRNPQQLLHQLFIHHPYPNTPQT